MPSLADFYSLLNVAFSVTAPIFLIITLGAWLNNKKIINQEFIQTSSKLIFNIGLPVMLFTSTASHDFQKLVNFQHIIILLATTLIVFFLTSVSGKYIVKAPEDKGVFVQGAFRGNLIIIGLALCANAYGEQGVAIATLPMAVIIIVYNLFSIYTLNASLHHKKFSLRKNLEDIIKNPLIIGICAGLLVNVVNLPIPNIIMETNLYLAKMTLPLALIGIGGSLNFLQLRENIKPALVASVWKIILSPVILIALMLIWPIDPISAGVLFFLAASPTATASFIMVKAMKGNSDLAAKIIIISTLLSLFTVTFGFAMLISFNLIAIN